MPGPLVTVLRQGYGYLDPYVASCCNAVPLFGKAAKKAEEVVTPLITRVDELTEPTLEKIKPLLGLARSDPIHELKELKDAKVSRLKKLAKPQVERIKGAVEPKMAQKVSEFQEFNSKGEKFKEGVGALIMFRCARCTHRARRISNLTQISILEKFVQVVVLAFEMMFGKENTTNVLLSALRNQGVEVQTHDESQALDGVQEPGDDSESEHVSRDDMIDTSVKEPIGARLDTPKEIHGYELDDSPPKSATASDLRSRSHSQEEIKDSFFFLTPRTTLIS